MPGFVRWGLGAGLVMSTVFFVPLLLWGPSPESMGAGEIVGYATMILALTATGFAMREARETRGGTITFGQAFAVGVGVSAVTGVLFGIATWAAFSAVGDALPEALIAYYQDAAQQAGSPEEVEARLHEMEQMRWVLYNRPLQGLVMFATVFPIGVVESLVAAFLVSRPS